MFEFGLGEVFEIEQFVARGFIDTDELVELEMQRRAIAVRVFSIRNIMRNATMVVPY